MYGLSVVEQKRKEEWNRRRLLRLEQVRQQSKDIASVIRQKVQNEREVQLGVVVRRMTAETQQWQTKQLHALQAEYNSTVQSIGKGHRDAIQQQDEDALRKAEAKKQFEAAQKRGREAFMQLHMEEAKRLKADSEKRVLKKQVYFTEMARSSAVASLPLPKSTVGMKRVPSKSKPEVQTEADLEHKKLHNPKKSASSDGWAKHNWSLSRLPLGVEENLKAQGDVGATSTNQSEKRSNFKEGREDIPPTQSSAGNCDVQMYDYSHCFRNQFVKSSGTVERLQPTDGELDAQQAAKIENSQSSEQVKLAEKMQERGNERGRVALNRAYVQRDYRQLMTSLASLSRQRATLPSETYTSLQTLRKEENDQQEKMNDELEKILEQEAAAADKEKATVKDFEPPETPDGSIVMSRIEQTPASLPRINVGRNDLRRTEEETQVSSNDEASTNLVPSPFGRRMNFTTSNRQDRNSALQSLLHQINEQREELLHSSQERKQEEIKLLEEQLKHQKEVLEEQQKEVQKFGESISIPKCRIQQHNEKHRKDSDRLKRSLFFKNAPDTAKEFNEDCVDKFHSTAHSDDVWNDVEYEIKNRVQKEVKLTSQINKSFEEKKYSMDLSVSSVTMENSSNSTSGSQSVSVRGVQVIVKVSGMENNNHSSSNGGAEFLNAVDFKKISDEVSQSASPKFDTANKRKQILGAKTNQPSHTQQHLFLGDDKDSSRSKRKSESKDPSSPTKKVHDSSKKSDRKKSPCKDKKKSKHSKEVSSTMKSPEKSKKVIKKDESYQRKKHEKSENTASSSTSYLSPPDRLLSTLTQDIRELMRFAQDHENTMNGQNESKRPGDRTAVKEQLLRKYICRLLAMSRESIENLNVHSSDISSPVIEGLVPRRLELLDSVDSSSASQVPQITGLRDIQTSPAASAPKEHPVESPPSDDSVKFIFFPEKNIGTSELPDQEALSSLTKQCTEKISTLTRMIEEIRQHPGLDSSNGDGSAGSISPNHFDSTAYMSPPPPVHDISDNSHEQPQTIFDQSVYDPYQASIIKILSEIDRRNRNVVNLDSTPEAVTTSQQENRSSPAPLQNQLRPRPPVAFWRNSERCNLTSPTEPHELSTIPEMGATLGETSVSLPKSGPPSPPSSDESSIDVISELMRRKLLTSPFAWAKKTKLSKNEASPHFEASMSLGNSGSGFSSLSSATDGSNLSASKEGNSVSIQSPASFSQRSKNTQLKSGGLKPADVHSSTDEAEVGFRNMGMGWVVAMLRKTKEVGALSSSSSDGTPNFSGIQIPVDDESVNLKEISGMLDEGSLSDTDVSPRRCHSTPVKRDE